MKLRYVIALVPSIVASSSVMGQDTIADSVASGSTFDVIVENTLQDRQITKSVYDSVLADEEPMIIKWVDPIYPKSAIAEKAQGTTVLRLTLSDSGRITAVTILKSSGREDIDQAATVAAWQYTFTPARFRGRAVNAWINLPIRFRLNAGQNPSVWFPLGSVNLPVVNVIASRWKGTDKYMGKEERIVTKFPERIVNAVPKYPEAAWKSGAEGNAFVKVLVDENGEVVQVALMRGDRADMSAAALVAASKFRFSPAMADDKPVPIWVNMSFRFRIKNE